jgi:hypothetical protein
MALFADFTRVLHFRLRLRDRLPRELVRVGHLLHRLVSLQLSDLLLSQRLLDLLLTPPREELHPDPRPRRRALQDPIRERVPPRGHESVTEELFLLHDFG